MPAAVRIGAASARKRSRLMRLGGQSKLPTTTARRGTGRRSCATGRADRHSPAAAGSPAWAPPRPLKVRRSSGVLDGHEVARGDQPTLEADQLERIPTPGTVAARRGRRIGDPAGDGDLMIVGEVDEPRRRVVCGPGKSAPRAAPRQRRCCRRRSRPRLAPRAPRRASGSSRARAALRRPRAARGWCPPPASATRLSVAERHARPGCIEPAGLRFSRRRGRRR